MIEVKMFAEGVANEILDYLPEKYGSMECQVVEMKKNNGVCLSGIAFGMPGKEIAPTIYMEPYYERIRRGADKDEVMRSIAGMVLDSMETQIYKEGIKFKEYDSVKDRLSAALVNTKANWKMLEGMPHIEMEDLSVIFRVEVPMADESKIGSLKVTNSLMRQWGVGKEELLNRALANMQEINPPVLVGVEAALSEAVFGWAPENLLEQPEDCVGEHPDRMYVLSNKSKSYGASALICPGVLEKLSAIFPEGFYILPSSVHETLIVSRNEDKTPRDFGQIVRQVNQAEVPREEILSDRVYEYNREKRRLRQIAESVERGREMER